MSVGCMRVAGWLALFSATVSIPLFLLALQFQSTADSGALLMQTLIQVVSTLLFCALLLLFRRFLHTFYTYVEADRSIFLMIILNVLLTLYALAAIVFTPLKESGDTVALAAVILLAVVQVRFALQLLRVPVQNEPLFRPYAWLNLAAGVCLATVILLPLAVLISALADLMLGTLFLQRARSVT